MLKKAKVPTLIRFEKITDTNRWASDFKIINYLFFGSLKIKKGKMDINTTKIELVKAILEIDNNEFIYRVADLSNKEKVFWNELNLLNRLGIIEQNFLKKLKGFDNTVELLNFIRINKMLWIQN